ncbi:MAG: flavin reductase family protein [Nitrososphaerales archaeon]
MKKYIMKGIERYFATGVGLITSTGRNGPNVMAAEWTLHISYDPMLIAVFIHKGEATYENIMQTREFGVNMSTDQQTNLVNISGGYSKKEIDKLGLGNLFKLYRAHYIKAPMIKDCIINAECKVVKRYNIGDHTAVIGEVVHAKFDKTKSPLIYHKGTYRAATKKLSSNRRQINVSKNIYDQLKTIGKGQFTLRCVAGLIRNRKNETLFVRRDPKVWHGRWMVPWFVVKRGTDHAALLKKYLKDLDVNVGRILGIDRVMFKHKSKELRANFVVYSCSARKTLTHNNKDFVDSKWSRNAPKNMVLKGLLSFR